jgi:UDP-glucuronate decarboxylase
MRVSNRIVREDLDYITSSNLPWDAFKNKIILVTGAAGFLPAYMVETLLYLNEIKALGCTVIGMVRNLDRAKKRFVDYASSKDLILVEADVVDKHPWTYNFDYIIHAASQASPKYYETDPVGTMTANILGTYNLLEYIKDKKCLGFLYFSSGEVYGTPNKNLVGEKDYGYLDIANTRSCYGESKRASETLGYCYHKQYNTPFVVVRPSHTYGPGLLLDDGRVFADFIRDVLIGKEITMKSDGKASRPFCYLSDATIAFFTVLLKGKSGCAYNVANMDAFLSVCELAVIVSKLGDSGTIPIKYIARSESSSLESIIKINMPRPDVSLIESLGWVPRILPSVGFKRTIDSFKISYNDIV